MKPLTFIFILATLLSLGFAPFSDPYPIKRISDTNYRYEFYTSSKPISPKQGRTYYWFRGGAIHTSQAGAAGELLDGTYTKMFLNNQLAEHGTFKDGLKNGVWQSWYQNGMLESRQEWKAGLLHNVYARYNEAGSLVETGKFKKGLKDGLWIDTVKKDTVEYSKGVVKIKKAKLSKAEKEAEKAEKECLREEQKKADLAKKKTKEVKNPAPKNPNNHPGTTKKATSRKEVPVTAKKGNFFQRLFSGSKEKE